MPFKSKAQARKCFAMKSRGQAKGWNCREWARKTNFSKLPEKKAYWARAIPAVFGFLRTPMGKQVLKSLATHPMVLPALGHYGGYGLGAIAEDVTGQRGWAERLGMLGLGAGVVGTFFSPWMRSKDVFLKRFPLPEGNAATAAARVRDVMGRLHSGTQASWATFLPLMAAREMFTLPGDEQPWWLRWGPAGAATVAGLGGLAGVRWPGFTPAWMRTVGGQLGKGLQHPMTMVFSMLGPAYGLFRAQQATGRVMSTLDQYLQQQGLGGIEGAMELLPQIGPVAQQFRALPPEQQQKLLELAQKINPEILAMISRFL